jgi:hypothetical protein
VILFKSSKITESKDNQVVFHHLIDNLKDGDINVIKNQTNIRVLIQAFEINGYLLSIHGYDQCLQYAC